MTPLRTIFTVIGTRPEAIKLAPVVAELGRAPQVRSVLCSTGQHREMLEGAFRLFGLRPDSTLDVMRPNQSLAGLTALLLTGLDAAVEQARPDWIVAQGDTTTAMVAGLVAYYRRIKFAHVEAGLRTHDRQNPFPEEINRRIADLVADLYFAPTARARTALLAEGVAEESIRLTGNTGIDALLDIAARPYDWAAGPLRTLPAGQRLVLITAHRRESFGEPFRNLCQAVRRLAIDFAGQGVHFVYPVHLNPHVRAPVEEILTGLSNLSLIEPLDYSDLVPLMKRSTLVLTDSGGIQEEAPSFGVPVLIMREKTERPEGIEAGVARLVGTRPEAIVSAVARLLNSPAERAAMAAVANPYGDGHAAPRIVKALLAPP